MMRLTGGLRRSWEEMNPRMCQAVGVARREGVCL